MPSPSPLLLALPLLLLLLSWAVARRLGAHQRTRRWQATRLGLLAAWATGGALSLLAAAPPNGVELLLRGLVLLALLGWTWRFMPAGARP